MLWPPVPVNGRIPYVEGAEATTVLIINVLSDLSNNPFNPDSLSLGDLTYKPLPGAEARIRATMNRLRNVAFVDTVVETTSPADKVEGKREFSITYTDRETRQRREVTVNG